MLRLFDLTIAHIADMHFVYGFCNGNVRAAVEEYRRRYPGMFSGTDHLFQFPGTCVNLV